MRLDFFFLGKTKEPWLATGIADYEKRLSHYTPVEVRIIKEPGKNCKLPTQALAEEGQALLANITRPALLVACDRTGEMVSSEELAALFTRWEGQGKRKIIFLLGGPLGLAPSVLGQADFRLSLSRLTFTHDMARLILLEQAYRAYAIKAGQQYHK